MVESSAPVAADHRPREGLEDFFPLELDEDSRRELDSALRVDQAARQDALAMAQSLEDENQDPVPEEPQPRRRKLENPGSTIHSVGISAVARSKRKGITCMHCTSQIPKGEIRFEFTFKANKPPRSIHPGCLSQMDGTCCRGSVAYLQTLLNETPPTDADELQACQEALSSLERMMSMTGN